MSAQNKELLFALLVGCLVLFVLAGFIIILIFLQKQKLKKMKSERELMRAQFDQQLLQSQLEVEEHTRKHIAQELHDNIGALSSLIKINLGLSASEASPQKKEALLDESRSLIKVLITELKHLAVSLNADRLNHFSLAEMLKIEVSRLKKMDLFSIDLQIKGDEFLLPPQKQIILYRVCQEILHNSLKHSEATKVSIEMNFRPDILLIQILDDGVGFDKEDKQQKENEINGSGLINLKNRIELLEGWLDLQTAPGKGTRYLITIPLNLQHEQA
jgi:two-component system, NarL family, sensor kinase